MPYVNGQSTIRLNGSRISHRHSIIFSFYLKVSGHGSAGNVNPKLYSKMDRKWNTVTTDGMEYKVPKCDIKHKERRHENERSDGKDKE
jgi:hypothetical protein